jgi:hypothetical protein
MYRAPAEDVRKKRYRIEKFKAEKLGLTRKLTNEDVEKLNAEFPELETTKAAWTRRLHEFEREDKREEAQQLYHTDLTREVEQHRKYVGWSTDNLTKYLDIPTHIYGRYLGHDAAWSEEHRSRALEWLGSVQSNPKELDKDLLRRLVLDYILRYPELLTEIISKKS